MSEKIYGQFDLDTIAKLADIVNDKNLGEITIVDGGKEITVKGRKCPPPPPVPMPAIMNGAPVQAAVPEASSEKPAAEKAESGNVVKSPIVGTFYAASAPDKPPFVTVGQQVKQGDVLFIIESMKVMSEVQSEFSGTVKEIFVSNGDSLEFDQPVMVIG